MYSVQRPAPLLFRTRSLLRRTPFPVPCVTAAAKPFPPEEQTRSALANAQVKALADQKAKNKALTHSLGLQKEENVLQLQQMRFYETSVQQFTPADLAGSGASYPSSASGWQR